MDAEEFFSRWAKRNTRPAQQGEQAGRETEAGEMLPEQPQALPAPTLDDVAALTPQSDFRRFVARGVDEDVRRSAMKKLFADPHFNVMDGLDVYIDDYNKYTPIPAAVLAALNHAQVLLDPEALFDTAQLRLASEEDGTAPAAGTAAGDTADPSADETETAEFPDISQDRPDDGDPLQDM